MRPVLNVKQVLAPADDLAPPYSALRGGEDRDGDGDRRAHQRLQLGGRSASEHGRQAAREDHRTDPAGRARADEPIRRGRASGDNNALQPDRVPGENVGADHRRSGKVTACPRATGKNGR